MFKPGKNHDGFFDSTKLIAQVNCIIDIFKGKSNGLAQGLFLFDNAPSHLKCAVDAISAIKMVKSASIFFFGCNFVLSMTCRSQASLNAPLKGATHA